MRHLRRLMGEILLVIGIVGLVATFGLLFIARVGDVSVSNVGFFLQFKMLWIMVFIWVILIWSGVRLIIP